MSAAKVEWERVGGGGEWARGAIHGLWWEGLTTMVALLGLGNGVGAWVGGLC